MFETQIIPIPILPFGMVNAHLVRSKAGCVLIDAGIPGSERKIGSRPSCVDGPFAARGFDVDDDGSGASMCPACLRGPWPLALMKSADRVPNQRVALGALDGQQVVPIPGLTGSSSNLITLGTSTSMRVVALSRPVTPTLPRPETGRRNSLRARASPRRCGPSCSPRRRRPPERACARAAWLPRACWSFPSGRPE